MIYHDKTTGKLSRMDDIELLTEQEAKILILNRAIEELQAFTSHKAKAADIVYALELLRDFDEYYRELGIE